MRIGDLVVAHNHVATIAEQVDTMIPTLAGCGLIDGVTVDERVVLVGDIDALASCLVDDVVFHHETLLASEGHIACTTQVQGNIASRERAIGHSEEIVVLAIFIHSLTQNQADTVVAV